MEIVMKYHYLYKTVCTVTNRYYVGMHTTDDMDDGYIGSGKILQRSIAKYGREAHRRIILAFYDSREAVATAEKEMVTEEFLQLPEVMNLKLGGESGRGWTVEQQRLNNKKSQAAQKILQQDPEWAMRRSAATSRSLRSQYAEGRRHVKVKPHIPGTFRHSAETKRAISLITSAAQQGKGNSQFGTCWIWHELVGNKKCKKNDLPLYIEQGWIKGRK
jgi:hypothetical protein